MFRLASLLILIFFAATASAQTASKPFRIGVAGLNHGHAGVILSRAHDGDIEIVGIAEPDRALAEQYLKKFNLPITLWYPTLAEMLDKAKPEAVTGFNSTFDHLEVVKACAPRKIHVMVEKPLAVNNDHARQIAALAEQHKIHVLVNYETTWYGSNTDVSSRFITDHPFGKIRKAVVHDGHQGPKEIHCGPEFLAWLTDPVKNGGGALMDFGCYGANLLTWLHQGARPLAVVAVTQQLKPNIYPKVDDEATIVLTYPDGQAIIQASWNWPFGRKDMEIYGETGYVLADKQGSRIRSAQDKPEEYVKSPELKKPYNDPFVYLGAVVRGEITVGPSDLSSLQNNLIVVEILQAAKESAQQGKTIYLKK
ncbi:Gfo/Idh/MocA family protein [Chryseolinea soli]|uniref:Gfo/Idh/MocA family oxidoreductase n=1 Tax=Chryseolinea soli TaxID=2321403 RepID=A0A385SSB4_9BACT|nr:Gfo/Idh/MocA family oxidoreductase [Chryseolinea soli]AYB33782.1 gfo/Idh/MocA family oxidoreductase [Chryseolinea soli]